MYLMLLKINKIRNFVFVFGYNYELNIVLDDIVLTIQNKRKFTKINK